jgi:hypothetical protein
VFEILGKDQFYLLLLSPVMVLICSCLEACARQPTVVRPTEVTNYGRSSIGFITDCPAAREGMDFEPPRPIGALALPEYPATALQARAGSAVVVLRFVISVEGDVTEVGDSPKAASTVGPFAAQFRAAAEKAVRCWRFKPAEWQWVEPGKDLNCDGKPDYVRVLKRQRVSVYMDVRFDFDMVAREGRINPPLSNW